MNVIRANIKDNSVKAEMSRIFVEGFYQWLQYFSKDKTKLANALAHMFNLDVFYLAEEGGRIAGFAACNDGSAPTVVLDKSEFTKYLGAVKGRIAYSILKKEFEEKQYPFEIAKDMGMVEFVATAPEYRGKGVATTIIRHIFDQTPRRQYVLEVADTNTTAVQLYERLGFREFQRVPQENSKRSGVNYLVYMKYEKHDG